MKKKVKCVFILQGRLVILMVTDAYVVLNDTIHSVKTKTQKTSKISPKKVQ